MVLQQLDLLPLIVSAVWLQILALAMPTLLVTPKPQNPSI
jgi:hypothetical protein